MAPVANPWIQCERATLRGSSAKRQIREASQPMIKCIKYDTAIRTRWASRNDRLCYGFGIRSPGDEPPLVSVILAA